MLDPKKKPLTLDHALAILRAHERALKARGVSHAAIFGSLARGEARADSDVDVMIELDPDAHVSLFGFAGLQIAIEELMGTRTDLVQRQALKPAIKARAEAEKVDAF
jgi:predicted nucleotidyltransferase